MDEVTGLTLKSETPLALYWIFTQSDNMPITVGTTEGFDPLVYAGSLIPFNNMVVNVKPIGDNLPNRTVIIKSSPPDKWTGRVLLLSERLQEMKAAGIYLPGFDGYNEWQREHGPFAQPGITAAAEKAWQARVEALLNQILKAVAK